jgi:phage terminase large subunit-like protein
MKANPAIAEGFSAIDGMRISVKTTPETTFRLLRLGQWVDGADGWLGENGYAVWNALADPFEFELGAPTWVGVDIGLRRDSTAIVAAQRRPDGRVHVKAKIFLPPQDGRLDVTDAMEHLRRLHQAYDLKSVDYDRHLFELAAQQLADEGLPMVDTPQTLERMTPIIGSTYEAIRSGGISHDGEPAFSAQVLAAVAKFNPRGFTLEKRKARDRIDAAIAMSLAVHAAVAQQSTAVTNYWTSSELWDDLEVAR